MIKHLPQPPWPIWQNPTEFALLYDFIARRQPSRILEIGAFYGGTLWHWANLTPDILVSLDLPVPESSHHWAEVWRCRGEWEDVLGDLVAEDFIDLIGRSDDWFKFDAVRHYGPYDFMFIDGDHSYQGVKGDFARFLPMLAKDGAIALHDTRRHEPGVIQFSEEIRELYPSIQFFSPDWGAGITVVLP